MLKGIAQSNISKYIDAPIYSGLPYIFNVPLYSVGQLGVLFNLTSCDQWYLYDFDDDVSEMTKEFWGSNEGTPIFTPKSEGLLDGTTNVLQTACPAAEKAVPYFKANNDNETINQYLFRTLEHLNRQQIDFKEKDSEVPDLELLPDGAFSISEASEEKLQYNIQVNDLRYIQYHRNNGITKLGIQNPLTNATSYFIRTIEGQISAADLINKAYISKLFPNTYVYSGVQIMPLSPSFDQEIMRVINLLGSALFPLSLCLLLPVFIYNIVLEKEQKLIEIMKMNGLRMHNYWIISWIFDMIMYWITIIVFLLFGRFVLKLSFFSETSYWVLLVFFMAWGLCQISMAFFFAVFLNQAQTASIVGYLLSIWVTLVAISLNTTLYAPPKTVTWWLLLYPTFPYTRFFFYLATACGYSSCISSFSELPDEAKTCLWVMYVEAVVFMLLALYLQQVVPQTFGVAKHPFFLCKAMRCKKKRESSQQELDMFEEAEDADKNRENDHDILSSEDADSKHERNTVYNLERSSYYKYPLIIKDIRKVYPGFGGRPKKVATKKFCLRIKKGELFGLLGPNGAGKTTLISMLTGLYRPDAGNAWVAGFDIKNQLDQVQLQMGVCPQFDILWSDLTIEEHLLFYARIKGISPKDEKAMVKKAMQEVYLERFSKFKVTQLSGGMKRRLSVAISLVGDPKIVYLDEPSTGLDPENRRQLWDILAEIRGSRAVMLTTHSMEEADVLCNRIGIVTDGTLRCIGPQVRLKTLYGGGYHLFINCHKAKYINLLKKSHKEMIRNSRVENDVKVEEDKEDMGKEEFNLSEIHKNVKDFVHELISTVLLLQEFNGNFIFQIPIEGFDAERLFTEMEGNKTKLKISDWGISQCSLEDVFTRICTAKEDE
jgi:ABC-type multidrug transport system ATPase subunit